MQNYVIAETWNGEGYSFQNKAYLKQFESDEQAQEFIRTTFNTNEKAEDWNVTEEQGKITFENEDGDAGTYQWHNAPADLYGVEIWTNVNEVQVHNEQGYKSALEYAIEQADEDEEIDEESPFISAYESEYDYQFIVL
jgi:hypothetical protein